MNGKTTFSGPYPVDWGLATWDMQQWAQEICGLYLKGQMADSGCLEGVLMVDEPVPYTIVRRNES